MSIQPSCISIPQQDHLQSNKSSTPTPKLQIQQAPSVITERQEIYFLELGNGQHFEKKMPIEFEGSIFVLTGPLTVQTEAESILLPPSSLLKLTADKTYKLICDADQSFKGFWIQEKAEFPLKPEVDQLNFVRKKADCFEINASSTETIWEFLGAENGDAQAHSVALVHIDENGSTDAHFHPVVEEIYIFTQGIGELVLDEQPQKVQAGDIVVIPVGTKHQLFNKGNEKIQLIVTCNPFWTPDCLVYS